MSLRNLTHGEYYYFRVVPGYRKSILEQLKELNLPLKIPLEGMPEVGAANSWTTTVNRIKAAAQGRATKYRKKWTFIRKRR